LEENLKRREINNFILTVDGKSSSGKSTAAKLLSRKFQIPHLSSGLLYRWGAKKIIDKKPKNKVSYLRKCFKRFDYKKIKKINLHKPDISKYSAIIAKTLAVRKIIKKTQKTWVKQNKKYCVIEGRDSHLIFPNALVKFYLKANLNTAALRRFRELKKKNRKITFKEVKNDLKRRDYSDTTRKHSPLILAKDHVVIRSDILNKSEMVKKMSKMVNIRLKQKYGFRNKFRK
tara:strand:- start:2145 stop:2834 length:690 start_codon:yes stop_codon:yes gene_type:complete